MSSNQTYTRRDFLCSAGLAAATALAGCAIGPMRATGAGTQRKPNLIVFLTDDQGYNDVGCFGSPSIKTPNFDRMAREGMMLTSYYVGSPVCGPSRAALIRIAEPQN